MASVHFIIQLVHNKLFYYFHEFYMIHHLLGLYYIGYEMTWCCRPPPHCVLLLLAVISP